MEKNILLALEVTGIGLLILLLILTFLAFLVSGMTSLIKSKDNKEDVKVGEEQGENQSMSVEQGVAEKAAALGVAFALAELEISPVSGSSEDNDFTPWRGFHRARRLNQTIRMRRNG
jgi:Na+-transporting methylmalonyl-CoA/oxaloacetate decarboxylase gamma subunit